MLEGLLKLPENKQCADCKCKGPRWASVNLGIFICMQCSGIHRSLGVHISKRVLHEEKKRWEHSNAANAKLLHECEILRCRLEECSVNFLIEEEDKLIVDSSSTSDAIDLLTTSDNRIGLLVAEAQLLAQDVENAVAAATHNSNGGNTSATDDELRKMLTDVFIDNASLRKQVNSVMRCALNTPDKSEKDDDEGEEEAPSRKTVLSKFLER